MITAHSGTLARKLAIAIALAFICLPIAALADPAAQHPPIAASPCDPAYFESQKAKAWLAAQEQVTENQKDQSKPDSVLEYTCFDKFAGVMAKNSKDMLTGTQRWGGADDGKKLTEDLNKSVGDAYDAYLTANYPKKMLGGKSNIESQRNGANGTEVIKEGSYNCDTMNKVMEQVRCEDFMANPETDGFYTDADYANKDDLRQFPTQCAKDNRYVDMRNTAGVDEGTSPPWPDDPAEAHTMVAADCGDAKYPPVATGREYRKSDGSSVPEKSCNYIPQCHYDYDAGKCAKD